MRPYQELVEAIRSRNLLGKSIDDDNQKTDDDGGPEGSDVDPDKPKKSKKKAKPVTEEDQGERQEGNEDQPSDEARGVLTPAQAKATAAAIVLAGQRRRGEVEIPATPPQPTPTSYFSGREQYTTPVKDPTALAAAIVAAAAKRRTPT